MNRGAFPRVNMYREHIPGNVRTESRAGQSVSLHLLHEMMKVAGNATHFELETELELFFVRTERFETL